MINEEILKSEIINLVNKFNSKSYDHVISSSSALIKKYPKIPILYNLLGASYSAKNDNKLAVTNFKKAIELDKQNFEYYNNLGKSYFALNLFNEAKKSFEESIQIEQNNYDAFFNIALIYQAEKKYENSISFYKKSIELNNNFSIAYYNLGIIYANIGEINLAKEKYKKAFTIDNNYFKAYNNYASLLISQKKYQEAKESLDKAISINPNYFEAKHNMGVLYLEQKKYESSLKYFYENIEIDENYFKSQIQKMYVEKKICDWSNFDKNKLILNKINKQKNDELTPWQMLSIDDNPDMEFRRASIFAKKFISINKLKKIKKTGKIRIGYFTPDFYQHAGMINMEGIFKYYNKEDFEIYGFDYGFSNKDKTHYRIKNYFDNFYNVADLSDKNIANLAKENQIDIAIHRNGYSQNSRTNIFSYRPAPIQVNFLGYPGTTGLDFIDYIIADKIVIPEENKKFFSEKIINLPDTYYPTFNERKIANLSLKREDLGIPKNAFVMCCFNNTYKISPVEFEIWMRVLKQIENSFLILLIDSSVARENLIKEAKKRNIQSSQIKFFNYIKIDEHLSRHKIADLYLDTFNYNGHTSVVDSLWAGVPVISKIGNSFSARVAASILTAINMKKMITKNEIEYEKLILDIGSNIHLRNKIKFNLIKNIPITSLFNTKNYVKNLEKEYKKIYTNYLNQ